MRLLSVVLAATKDDIECRVSHWRVWFRVGSQVG